MSYLRKLEGQLVECPFDKNHKVKDSRLQYHITRCIKQHPGFEVCPFDATHRLKKPEMIRHILQCPSRRRIQHLITMPEITGTLVQKHSDLRETPIHVGNTNFNLEDENWEEDLIEN